MIEISKELLSEVLDWNNEQKRCYKEHRAVEKNEISIYFFDADSTGKTGSHWWKRINIYELAHKCKEWAYKEGFIIDTGFHKYYINQFKANCYGWVCSNINIKQHFNECTEPEAIFKACQWILDNKES